MSKVEELENAGQLGLGFGQEEMTYVPPSDWTAPDPSTLPDKLHGTIAFDLETRDDGLRRSVGPGWAWEGGGRVIGYSVSADNWEGYLPTAHGNGKPGYGNMDPDLVRRVMNSWLGDETQLKVGANVLYDVGWAARDGVEVKGPIQDIQWAEAILDEHRWGYSLDSLAKTYLNEGKDEKLLREAAKAWGVDPKSEMWRLPAMFIGPYATADSNRTRRVFQKQLPKLQEQLLMDLFQMECDMIPLYMDARWRGVRVSVDRVEQLKRDWKQRSAALLEDLRRRTHGKLDVWSPQSVAVALDAENIPYGRTAKTGMPSINKTFLTNTKHWLTDGIIKIREIDKLVGTFLDGQILNHLHNGRVHAEFHPLRADDDEHKGGTIGGRGSMSNPNLQFIPERTAEGKEVRGCFLPEEGDDWGVLDYSQQEPRLTVHYACVTKKRTGEHLTGALAARDRYIENPDTDYHQMAMELTGLPRKPAKILNLAIIYGRGAGSTAEELGVSMDEAKDLISRHRKGMPFVPELSFIVQDRVKDVGQIRTIGGRVCRFPFWEPADWELAKGYTPAPLWKVKKDFPGKRYRRAWLHKCLNRLIQGSAADQMKKAMRDAHRAGLMKRFLIQVHDDMNHSLPKGSEGDTLARNLSECMRDAYKLEVPVKAEIKRGSTWGDVK